MKAGALRIRIAATAGVFFMLFLVALGRAFQLCVLQGPALKELARRQHRQRLALPPERGPIVDRHGEPLALTVESAAVFVRPGKTNPERNLVPELARTLDLNPRLVSEKFSASERFVWLLRGATPEQADAIAAL